MVEKYLDALAHWSREGWRVTGFDWRGQGGSGRLATDPHTGHVSDFATYGSDLQAFWAQMDEPGPRVLMGHSMGGHIALRAVLEGAVDPAALILSAPMLGFDTPIPAHWVAALVRLLARRWPERQAWSSNEKPGALSSRQAMLTHDTARYEDEARWLAHNPSLGPCQPSLSWLIAAWDSCTRIEALAASGKSAPPTLIFGTTADKLVSPRALSRIGGLLKGARMHIYGKEAAHELLRETDPVRADMIARIDAFLEEVYALHDL